MNLQNAPSFPAQKLSMRMKTTEWKEKCVDAIIGRQDGGVWMATSSKEKMQIHYDLYNSIYSEEDLMYVTNPYKVDDGFPATPQNFNIIRPKVDLLIGEESKRPFNFNIIQTNDDAVNMLQDQAKQLLGQYIEAEILSKMGGEEVPEEMLPSNIKKYLEGSYKAVPEKVAFNTLKYLSEKLNIQHEFLKGWSDSLKVGEEIYYVGIMNGEPFVERKQPKNSDYDRDCGPEFIEDKDWFLYTDEMTVNEIYDRFFDKFSEAQLDTMLEMINNGSTTSGKLAPNINSQGIIWNQRPLENSFDRSSPTIPVYHCVWTSFKKVGYLTYVDEFGSVESIIVDESYKKVPGETISWDWIPEIWEGYRVGEDLYLGIQPLEYQTVSIDDPVGCQKLPYYGTRYGKSMVEIMKALQYMYIIIWYRIELALARDKGKAVIMDITQIPKSMGIDAAKWMHYLQSMGVMFVNPYEEGWDIPGREGGKAAQFNQFSSVDMSMANVIGGYIQLLEKVEDMIGEICGVSKQRQGSIARSELVGNVERSVVQSSHITEPMFWQHNQVKKRVLTGLLNVAKHAWKNSGKQKLHYIFEDATRVFMDITDEFIYSDFDIFVTDSTKDNLRLEALKTLLQPAMQNGATLGEAAEILTRDNITEIKRKLNEIDLRKQQQEQQMQAAQQETQMQMAQMKQQSEQAKMELEREDSIRKSNTAIEVALIGAEARISDLDKNNDGQIDQNELLYVQADMAKLQQQVEKDRAEIDIKRKQLEVTAAKNRTDAELKAKEIEVKRIAANKKPASSSKK